MRTIPSYDSQSLLTAQPSDTFVTLAESLQGRRFAVASTEPEDAHITGMTRSLDRRLLALNLSPSCGATASRPSRTKRKVA